MLTGDSERTAAAIAAEVGVDDYRAEVLPEDKANFVEQERAAGHAPLSCSGTVSTILRRCRRLTLA